MTIQELKNFGEIFEDIKEEVSVLNIIENDQLAFDITRGLISKINVRILESLSERSHYPLCEGYFGRRDKIKRCYDLGLDTAGWKEIYCPFLKGICLPGELDKDTIETKVIPTEAIWQHLLIKRTRLGEHIVRYKIPREIPTEIKEREQTIYDEVRALAPAYNLSPDAVENFFRLAMEKSKRYQNGLRGSIIINGKARGISLIELKKPKSGTWGPAY